MLDPKLYHCIGNSVSRRASLLAKLAQDLAALQKRDEETSAKLVGLAPEDIREWVEEEGPLSVLYEYGKCEFKIHFGKGNEFSSHADLKERMGRLAKAWKDIVSIELERPEGGRVYARFTAIM